MISIDIGFIRGLILQLKFHSVYDQILKDWLHRQSYTADIDRVTNVFADVPIHRFTDTRAVPGLETTRCLLFKRFGIKDPMDFVRLSRLLNKHVLKEYNRNRTRPVCKLHPVLRVRVLLSFFQSVCAEDISNNHLENNAVFSAALGLAKIEIVAPHGKQIAL